MKPIMGRNDAKFRENYDRIWFGKVLPIKYYDGCAGEYLCMCIYCKCHFIGDKRDGTCPECEAQAVLGKEPKGEA